MTFLRGVAPLLVVATLGGCVWTGCYDPKQRSHENRQHREIESFEFTRPIKQVWPLLLQVLAEDGFTVKKATPVEGKTVRSELRSDGYRALIHVVRIDKKRYKIQLQRQYQSEAPDGGVTLQIEDWNVSGNPQDRLLWTLIERAEPAAASSITARLHKKP